MSVFRIFSPQDIKPARAASTQASDGDCPGRSLCTLSTSDPMPSLALRPWVRSLASAEEQVEGGPGLPPQPERACHLPAPHPDTNVNTVQKVYLLDHSHSLFLPYSCYTFSPRLPVPSTQPQLPRTEVSPQARFSPLPPAPAWLQSHELGRAPWG